MTDAARVVGVDIGGTKIAAAAVAADGTVLARLAAPTPRGAPALLDAVAELVGRLPVPGPPAAVGVGAPGVVDTATGTVVSATAVVPGWAGTAVGDELRRRLGCVVVVDNDVRMMAAGEARLGAGRGFDDVLFVSIGTGVGGALTRGGRIAHGPHFTGGEIGHLLVPAAGPVACGCGRRDHLEAAVSGPAVAADYARRTGERLTAVEVAARFRAGDADAAAAIGQAGALAGRALAGLVSAVDVSAVGVGGGVAQIGGAFLEPLAAALRAEVLPPLRDIVVGAARLGTDAPLIGAALASRDALGAGPPTGGGVVVGGRGR